MRRHLLYHCCPFAANDKWRWNLDQLRRRLPLFDGRRLVGLVTGPDLVEPAAVQAVLGDEVEYLVNPNDPVAGEVVTWYAGWPLLEREQGAVWYGHTKGVSKQNQEDRAYAVRRWAQVGYEGCLDYWPLVECHLDQLPLSGTFFSVGTWIGPPRSLWHYAGTMFWVRVSHAAPQRWRAAARRYGGVEMWPGAGVFPPLAGRLFTPVMRLSYELYDSNSWLTRFDPQYRHWCQEYASWRQPVGSTAA